MTLEEVRSRLEAQEGSGDLGTQQGQEPQGEQRGSLIPEEKGSGEGSAEGQDAGDIRIETEPIGPIVIELGDPEEEAAD